MQRRYLRGLFIAVAIIALTAALPLTGCQKKIDPTVGPSVSSSDSSTSKYTKTVEDDDKGGAPDSSGGKITSGDLSGDYKTPDVSTPAVDPDEDARIRMQFNTEDIHFAFDSSDLSTEAMSILKKKKDYMILHPDASVMIQGHCDERGSNEYNLALGDRRANSARNFLTDLGIDARRIETVSYGEEAPLDPGHNEAAWAANRRAHFVLQ